MNPAKKLPDPPDDVDTVDPLAELETEGGRPAEAGESPSHLEHASGHE